MWQITPDVIFIIVYVAFFVSLCANRSVVGYSQRHNYSVEAFLFIHKVIGSQRLMYTCTASVWVDDNIEELNVVLRAVYQTLCGGVLIS